MPTTGSFETVELPFTERGLEWLRGLPATVQGLACSFPPYATLELPGGHLVVLIGYEDAPPRLVVRAGLRSPVLRVAPSDVRLVATVGGMDEEAVRAAIGAVEGSA